MLPEKFTNIVGFIVILFIISACVEKPQPGSGGGEPAVDHPTATQRSPSTRPPTVTPTSTLTFTPTQWPSPTYTDLPPIPDFDEVLVFGGAGATRECEYPPAPDDLIVNSSYSNFGYGNSITLCIFLSDVSDTTSIQVHFTQLDEDGMDLWSKEIFFNKSGNYLYWETQDGVRMISRSIELWTDDNSIKFALYCPWPLALLPGNWRVRIIRNGGLQATKDFQISKDAGYSYIDVVKNSERTLMPYSGDLPLSNSDPLNFIGTDYPHNVPVYILLYKRYRLEEYTLDPYEYRLTEKKLFFSNETGIVSGEISGPFEEGAYILYGITDPNTKLGEKKGVSCEQTLGPRTGSACQHFSISITSCPGAPPQRMEVYQLGYVCTAVDSVRLREAPSRSANSIVLLPIGSQFIVTDGPSCADDWSWWEIEMLDGSTGWISEGGDENDPYFICPIH